MSHKLHTHTPTDRKTHIDKYDTRDGSYKNIIQEREKNEKGKLKSS